MNKFLLKFKSKKKKTKMIPLVFTTGELDGIIDYKSIEEEYLNE